jgi:tRNA threonylcarbamoyladenosine biosynthesis protein TsaE
MISKQIQAETHSIKATKYLGEKIGAWLNDGIVIALTGDLGSGKTSFVQGLAKGLDVPDEYYITSPSFTLINEYPGRYPLFHVDLYRIGDPVDFEDIGLYEILHEKGVVAIEWAEKLPKALLTKCLTVHFEISDDESRKICLTAYGLEGVNLLKKIEKSMVTNPSAD